MPDDIRQRVYEETTAELQQDVFEQWQRESKLVALVLLSCVGQLPRIIESPFVQLDPVAQEIHREAQGEESVGTASFSFGQRHPANRVGAGSLFSIWQNEVTEAIGQLRTQFEEGKLLGLF